VQDAHFDGVRGLSLYRERQATRHEGRCKSQGFEIATTIQHKSTPIKLRKVGKQAKICNAGTPSARAVPSFWLTLGYRAKNAELVRISETPFTKI
jgi:hypothetical protein